MYRWCSKTQEIHDFFTIIQKEAPAIKTSLGFGEAVKMNYDKKF